VLARAILNEGCKSVAAGMNPMDLRRGINLAVDNVLQVGGLGRGTPCCWLGSSLKLRETVEAAGKQLMRQASHPGPSNTCARGGAHPAAGLAAA
jgi:hypothetical protein